MSIHPRWRLRLLLAVLVVLAAILPWGVSSLNHSVHRVPEVPEGDESLEAASSLTASRPGPAPRTSVAQPTEPASSGPWVASDVEIPGNGFYPGRVELTGPTHGWVTSRSSGVLFRWTGDALEAHELPGRAAKFELSGLHAVSDSVVWVVANPKDCADASTPAPLIARFDSTLAAWDVHDLGPAHACSSLNDVWMGPGEGVGFAGGGQNPDSGRTLWVRWDGHHWRRQESPIGFEITAIELDDAAQGFVGFSLNACPSTPCQGHAAVMHFAGGTFQPASKDDVEGVAAMSGDWAVGQGTALGDLGPKLYRRVGPSWGPADGIPAVPFAGFLTDVDSGAGPAGAWVAGFLVEDDDVVGVLGHTSGEAWTVQRFPRPLRALAFDAQGNGLAVGDGVVLLLPGSPP